MHLAEVLRHLRSNSISLKERGTRFEKLIRAWLLADPVLSSEIAQVWMWEDFPAKNQLGGNDLGIDLVARTHLGEYWAIQCKFYGETTNIDKKAVDSFITNSGRKFIDPISGNETAFSIRYWISSNDHFNAYAEEMTKNQTIPFHRITFENLAQSAVDWEALYFGKKEQRQKKEAYKHQQEALEQSIRYFAGHDRGRLIMACGTGKSYTSLLIAEKLASKSCLVLMPSIALVNQMLNAWLADATRVIKPICVCSDAKASLVSRDDWAADDLTSLILAATTDPHKVAKQYLAYEKQFKHDNIDGLVVIFSTYQSIDAVADAQKAISRESGSQHSFDLIVCDEAHRTTGIIRPGELQSDFSKIHNEDFIRGRKRLYMTATPRLYADNIKAKVKQSDYELCSMDDTSLYGDEIYRVGFGYAVANGLLTDYKVLVLTVGSEHQLPEELRQKVHDNGNKELDFDISSKLVGCINGLAKNTVSADNTLLWQEDPRIMRRAIAFCANIDKNGDPASSKNTQKIFPEISRSLTFEDESHKIHVEARHIDGTMDSAKRAEALMWLGEEFSDPEECRVLCNVRCLSEGIDVPALDAAIFLSPRNSQIDVVQSVGRVMRNFHKGRSDEKKFGYIIIPIVVNPNVQAEEALNDNKTFAVLWSILNALRSHDERFNAMINSIALNKEKPKQVVVDSTRFYDADAEGNGDFPNGDEAKFATDIEKGIHNQMTLLENVNDKLYAKMVEKVGSRLYWERWARDIAPLARNIIGRITELVSEEGDLQTSFDEFLQALRASINDSISREQAVEMLAQHMITRPVFEALFSAYAFNENNAVSRAMKTMTDKLVANGLEKDMAQLDKFYDSVRLNLGTIKTLAGRQSVIKNLYDSFFRSAFPKSVEQLGIVYTPVECVDFILHSVDAILKKEFNLSISDNDVHVLDPFTGTGTFISRLLQSNLIRKEDLRRKYQHELHCNEIVLLAYYVADVNIESVYEDLTGEYLRFDGITLTDTFELTAHEPQPELYTILKGNLENIEKQQKAPVRVIIGNPPYSVGQKSGNDNAQNLKYPELDARIEKTYVSAVKTTNKNSLYDSYIRAFRWATDRLNKNRESGVIGFITNGGWLDGNAAAGFRKCLEREFASIYVFHLRGDQRTSGELSRREGGKIFGSGSRAPVVITILAYDPAHTGKAKIYYSDIGDYLSREQKLQILSERRSIFDKKIVWKEITPNEHGDWLNQRTDLFGSFIVIGDKKDKENKRTFFEPVYSNGLQTNRDAWVYNFSKNTLKNNIKRTILFYNEQCEAVQRGEEIVRDKKLFSWSRGPLASVKKNKKFSESHGFYNVSAYRPFTKENSYISYSRELTHEPGQWPLLFPTADTENLVISMNGLGSKKDFSCIMQNGISNLWSDGGNQCFPLYYYKEKRQYEKSLLEKEPEYQHKDGITDWILRTVRGRFGNARSITKETIFYYVYGILHSPEYRQKFNDDLKKALPHIPIVEKVETFIDFSETGRRLAELHINYESADPYPAVVVTGVESGNFHVDKMKFAGKPGAWDKTTIIYNSDIQVSNIPLRAYRYVVNGRSAIEWIMDSYRIKTDTDSGIVNDPNAWAEEHEKPRYILDLLLSIIGLSMKTLDLVAELPKQEFNEDD